MNRKEAYISTHFTDITESRHGEVRKLQAEMAHAIVCFLGKAPLKAIQRPSRETQVRRLDQA
ncbi:hypothetical protein [Aliiruegeria sabulilitoris]|uniref:hypothetical protein n=1 Tax=Aliiruegeria sabulilitoris TaxID=1510458 RepID=UPI00082FA270|nr:hypothetical protein [Aliiruegeria sabulilitoris]NDR57402.1 hypothetical protein [Pseudoruegeria sp. M32A2M]